MGQLAVLSELESLVAVVAECDSVVVRVARGPLLRAMAELPSVVARLASSIVATLSPLVRQIDFALDWVRAWHMAYKGGQEFSFFLYLYIHVFMFPSIFHDSSSYPDLC